APCTWFLARRSFGAAFCRPHVPRVLSSLQKSRPRLPGINAGQQRAGRARTEPARGSKEQAALVLNQPRAEPAGPAPCNRSRTPDSTPGQSHRAADSLPGRVKSPGPGLALVEPGEYVTGPVMGACAIFRASR